MASESTKRKRRLPGGTNGSRASDAESWWVVRVGIGAALGGDLEDVEHGQVDQDVERQPEHLAELVGELEADGRPVVPGRAAPPTAATRIGADGVSVGVALGPLVGGVGDRSA